MVSFQFLTLSLTLPFSRRYEAEADFIGYGLSLVLSLIGCLTQRDVWGRLLLMASAGYDPRQAIALWARFSKVQPSGTRLIHVPAR